MYFWQKMGRLSATVAGTDPSSTGAIPTTLNVRRRLQMNKFRFTLTALAIMAVTLLVSSSAQAQASRTWVSGVGDDANPCSRTAPCKTFAGAISKTATHGEINCLDPGGFGAVTITKSIQIDCHEIFAGILNSGVSGVIINFTSFTDTRKSVRLRNLNINGANTGLNGIRIIGSAAATGTEVSIEDCLIDGQFGSPGRGIEDFRQGGGLLVVDNTTIRNVGSAAVSVDPTGAGGASSTQINVRISNSRVTNTVFGLNFGSNVKASIWNTVVTGVTNAGVFAIQNSGGTTEIAVDECVINSNGTGVNASTANTIIRVSNSTLMNNTTLFTAVGSVLSYGNNQTGGAALGAPVPGGQG
jgi:hypothetical protein